MNEELQQALIQFVTMITESAQAVGEFGAEQAPEVIGQLIAWGMTLSLILFFFFAFVTVGSIMLSIKSIRESSSKVAALRAQYDAHELWTRYTPSSSVTSLQFDTRMFRVMNFHLMVMIPAAIGIIGMVSNLEWLKILIAPKVWLIEYASSLIK